MVKKTLSSAILLALISGNSIAASNMYPVGTNLGYGDVGSPNSIYATSTTPSWLSANQDKGDNIGIGFSLNGGIEWNNFQEMADQYSDKVSPLLDKLNGDNITVSEKTSTALELKDELNSLVSYASDNAYIQGYGGFTMPIVGTLAPYGGLSLEISANTAAKARLLTTSTTPISLDTSVIINNPDGDAIDALGINAAFYLKNATQAEISMAYANNVWETPYGNLNVGVRGTLIQARLSKVLIGLQDYVTESSKDGGDIDTKIKSDMETLTSAEWQQQFGVDLSAMFVSNIWLAGVSILNINSPSFTYNTIGKITDKNDANQYLPLAYSHLLSLNETVELVPQTRLEGAVFTQGRELLLSGSFDVNSSVDLLNNPYQWLTVSGSYATSGGDELYNYFIPDVRLGYRQNMTGTEKKYISAGLSFVGINLDMAVDPGLEAFMFNLGAEVYF